MSVLSYLDKRASQAVLSEAETSSISTSIATLKSRLNAHFGSALTDHFQFGSSTRGTILPRKMDRNSDIDYMVAFAEKGYSPQTYLDRLKGFVSKYYSSSEVYQSSPTIVLELNHIKFELVPALKLVWSGYQIPNGSGGWLETDPNAFNETLTNKNKSELQKIKPTVRLVKFWNANAGVVYGSYLLEKWIVGLSFYGCISQTQYLFKVFDNMTTGTGAQWRDDKITRAREIVAKVRQYERDNMPISAESEVKKLIPE